MDSDFMENRGLNSAWNVAGVAIAVFFAMLFLYNLFS